MKKILLILAALTVSAAAFAEKITTVAEITSGNKYYIGATTGENDYYFYVDGSSTTESIKGVAKEDVADAVALTFTAVTDGWTIQFDEGLYLGLKNAKDNGAVQVMEAPVVWTIEEDTDNGLLKLHPNDYYLRKNSSGTQFGSYKDGHTNVWLEPAGATPVLANLDSLVIKGKAEKMEYELGEAFDPAGLEVWGIYTKTVKHDSTSQIKSGFEWTIDPEIFEWAGDNESVTIVASYKELTTADTTITGINVKEVVPGRLAPCCINGTKLTINDKKDSKLVNFQYFKIENDERINGIAGTNPDIVIQLYDTEGYCEINYTNKDDGKRNFIVNPKIENAVDSIYQGETYLFADTLLTTAGTYQRTIESNTMTLTLKVKQKRVEIKDAEFTYGDAGNNLINFTLGNSDYSFDLYVNADNVVGDFKEVVDLTESSIETSNGTISLLEVYSFSVTGIGKDLTLTVSVLGSDNKQYDISATGYYGYIQGDAKDGCNKEFAAKGIALKQIKINEVNYISIQGESASGDVMEIAVKGELNDGKIATGTYTDIAASTGFTPEYQVFPSYIGNNDAVWFIQSGTLTVAADGSMKFVGVNSYDASVEITISASGPTVDKTGITINGRKYGFPVRMVTDIE